MKSLQEWLSSSEDEKEKVTPKKVPSRTDSPGRVRSPKAFQFQKAQQAAEDARKRREDLAQRMKDALGEVAVKEPVRVSDSFSSFNSEVRRSTDERPPIAPPMAGVALASPVAVTVPPINTAALIGSSQEEPYGVYVCDRGCQTVSEISTQTDPDPQVLTCAESYRDYYGHAPPAPAMRFLAPQFAARAAPSASYPTVAPAILGGYAPASSATHQAWTLQVHLVQRMVDDLINKYNLPPPPAFPHV